MADKKEKKTLSPRAINNITKLNRNITDTTDQLLDGMETSIYGSTPSTEVDALDSEFADIVSKELKSMTSKMDGDVSGFLDKLYTDSQKRSSNYVKNVEHIFQSTQNQAQSILTEAYRNKMLKRADIKEVASQLNELREAINITRDAVVSSNMVEGDICRTLVIDNSSKDESENYKSIVEKMEEKFKLTKSIKNFIVPQTLEQGEYYAYIIPYDKIFSDFMRDKDKIKSGLYGESTTVLEHATSEQVPSFTEVPTKVGRKNVIDRLYENVSESTKSSLDTPEAVAAYKKGIESIVDNISVCNDPISIAVLEEGTSAIAACIDDLNIIKEADESRLDNNPFNTLNGIDSGVMDSKNDKSFKFDETKDCYLKFIDSLHMIPVKIMSKTIGYYYIQDDELVTSVPSNYFVDYSEKREPTLVNAIVDEVISSFDKKFLKENIKFRTIIAEAIQYYNLNERKIRFQFIPAEYVVAFKINEDEEGNGTSVIEPALFYAKLYLLLLLFKMVSIVSSSNDTKVHYIRSSGIDKNIANTVQEVARKMQARQVNLTDMFTYTTLINKVGNGNDLFIPLGRGDTRGIETEILAGQDVQLNSELMELLRNSYISATGVPAVIMNSINESEFAKTIELGNTRFEERVVSEQIDFNEPITEMYRMLMKYTTNIPDSVISNFRFEFQSPKHNGSQITNDLLGNFDTLYQFAVSLVFSQEEVNDESGGSTHLLREFKRLLAQEKLPVINVERIMKLADEARVKCKEGELKDAANGNQDEEEDYGEEAPPEQ